MGVTAAMAPSLFTRAACFWQPGWIDVDDLGVLLKQSAAGDQGAFAGLYDALSPLVFGIVKRVVRDPTQAEEVTQEVFVNVWRNSARFDPARGSVRTWAATIAHRRAVDRVRSEQAHRDREQRDAHDVSGDRSRRPTRCWSIARPASGRRRR